MPILSSLLAPEQRSFSSIENPSVPLAAGGDWGLDVFGGFRATSGVNVNRETALTYASLWRGVCLISGDVAKLPVHVYKQGDTGKVWDTRHAAYYLLRRKPNAEMTAYQFKRTIQMHALLEGNGYAFIERLGDGSPVELIPLQPNRTYPIRVDGKMLYITELATGEPRKIDPYNMLHIKGLSFDGLVGYSVVTKARESLGLGMALDTYGSTFFRNGAEPKVAIVHPGRLTPEALKNLRESWERIHSGLENAHKTAILQEGMDIKQYSLSAKDAQLIEQRAFQKAEVADWLNLPPHKLGIMSGQGYNSLEQENQDYLDSAIDPWLVCWEEECDDKLLTEVQKKRDSHKIEFHRKALIRADMRMRTTYYKDMLSLGCLNRDEVRDEEGFNPIPDGSGKLFFVPLNMASVKGIGNQETEDPGEGGDGGDAPISTGLPSGKQSQQPASSGRASLLEVPNIPQPDHYSCGACAAMSVGKYFSVGPDSLDEWKAALGTDAEQSTRPMAIVDYLQRLGLVVTARQNMTLDDLRRCWQAGQPVICCVQDYGPFLPGEAQFDYGHYLTVIGVSLGYVFCQDSSEDNVVGNSGGDQAPGRVMIAEDTWLKNWHDTDIDGNPYTQFGIAVGKTILPQLGNGDTGDVNKEEGVDDEAAGGPGESISPTDQSGTAPYQTQSNGQPITETPAREIVQDCCLRVVRRIGKNARRVAKQYPKTFVRFLDELQTRHYEPVYGYLKPVFREVGPPAINRTAEFLAALRESLLEAAGRATADQLAAEVDAEMKRWEAKSADDFLKLLRGEN